MFALTVFILAKFTTKVCNVFDYIVVLLVRATLGDTTQIEISLIAKASKRFNIASQYLGCFCQQTLQIYKNHYQ
jgi:hypothetical protein